MPVYLIWEPERALAFGPATWLVDDLLVGMDDALMMEESPLDDSLDWARRRLFGIHSVGGFEAVMAECAFFGAGYAPYWEGTP